MASATIQAVLSEFFPGSFGPGAAYLTQPVVKQLLERLEILPNEPLRRTEFNQLIHLVHEAGVSDGFFRYYFLERPPHFYPVQSVAGADSWSDDATEGIRSMEQLAFGLRRFYIDALYCYGDLRNAYRSWRHQSYDQLLGYFDKLRYDENMLSSRGPHMPFVHISKDDRYLISEMAYGAFTRGADGGASKLENALVRGFAKAKGKGKGESTRLGDLLTIDAEGSPERERDQFMLQFAADEFRNEQVNDERALKQVYDVHEARFSAARNKALVNTRLYLSLVNELDVYVATSMRSREDFRVMADDCEIIFGSPSVAKYGLRYFDPTVSAAAVPERRLTRQGYSPKLDSQAASDLGKKVRGGTRPRLRWGRAVL